MPIKIEPNPELEAEICNNIYRARDWAIKILGVQVADDAIQDACLATIIALREIEVLDPAAYATGVLRHIVMRGLQPIMFRRRYISDLEPSILSRDLNPNPEQLVIISERRACMLKTLSKLSPKNREVLVRGYVNDETKEETQEAMGLGKHQYILLKNRAKDLAAKHAVNQRKADKNKQRRVRRAWRAESIAVDN